MGQERGGEDPGLPVPPRTHTPPWFFPSASLGSGLGPLGRWCLKLTELPCPSCLLGEGVELAGELAHKSEGSDTPRGFLLVRGCAWSIL